MHTKTEVIVTFLQAEEKKENKLPQKRILGRLEGRIKVSDDFDDPLDDLKD